MAPKRKSTSDDSSSQAARKAQGQGVRLTCRTKQIVENIRKFFEKEKQCRSTINWMVVMKHTAEATGLSERTVRDIHNESVATDGQLLIPVKRYTVSRICVNLDSFDREAIHQLVHNLYTWREYPSLDAVLEKAKGRVTFLGAGFCLWRLLQQMVTYKKRDNKKYIYEQKDILEQRHTYLRTIHKLRQENANLIYTDETWVKAHHNKYIRVDSDGIGGWKVPSGRELRLIILHAGGVDGWVDGADLVFRSKTNSGDYHDEMNSEHFMEWMTRQLLLRLEEPSEIILDNASYHNRQKDIYPATKDDIKAWLNRHNIRYNDTDIKITLLDKVRQYRPRPLYLTDKAAHEHGHTVLCLPVAHCELNPIELAWASVKGYIARRNTRYTLQVQKLTPEGLAHTTADMWRKFCRHVVKVEEDYMAKNGIVEDINDEMIPTITPDSYDSDEEDLIDKDDRQSSDCIYIFNLTYISVLTVSNM